MPASLEFNLLLNLSIPYALFTRDNQQGMDSTLLDKLEELKKESKLKPLLSLFGPPKSKTESGLIEFSESRRCLIMGLEKVGKRFENSRQIFASLSHTAHKSAALVCLAEKSKTVGVGLDIESLSRKVSLRAQEKFILPEEGAFGLSPLEIWTIKEAAFKSTFGQKGSLFLHKIEKYDCSLGQGVVRPVKHKSLKIDFQTRTIDDLIVTLAVAATD